MATQPPALPQTVYAVFSGEINQDTVQRIINAATNVMGKAYGKSIFSFKAAVAISAMEFASTISLEH